jgi:imidazolonepropionase-like amidohydrolase
VPGTLIVRGVTLIDGTGAEARPNMDVVISGDRFEDIRPSGSRPEAQDGQVIDGTGAFLMPGLWEAHTHLRGVLGDDAQAGLDRAMRAYLARGITTVVDLGGPIEPFSRYRERLRKEGPSGRAHVLFAGPPFTGIGGWPLPLHGNPSLVNQVASAEQAQTILQAQLGSRPDVVKIIYDGEPGAPDKLSPEALRAVIAGAHQRHVRVMVHVRTAQDCVDALQAGADGIEHAFLPAPGREREETEQVCELLLEKDAYLTPTLAIWEQLGRAGDEAYLGELVADGCMSQAEVEAFQERQVGWGQSEFPHHPKAECLARFEAALRMLPVMHAADVKLAAGSDIATVLPRPAAALRELALLAKAGIPARDIVPAATRHAAEKLGLAATLGAIEPGKLADAILLSASPLDDVSVMVRPGRLLGVIKRGELTRPL